MPERRGDSVFSEPAFNGSRDSCAGTDQEVWEEPTLQSPPPFTPGTFRAGLKAGWEHTPSSTRVSAFLGLIAVSGLVGIGCSLLQEWSQRALLAAIVFVPVIEELGKTLGPILVLERRPFCFSGRAALVSICAVSGLVFAAIENLLYLNVYIPHPTVGIVLFRWTACVALHAGCSTIAGFGLAREWRNAAAKQGRADPRDALPFLVTAMVIHGVYNLVVFFAAALTK